MSKRMKISQLECAVPLSRQLHGIVNRIGWRFIVAGLALALLCVPVLSSRAAQNRAVNQDLKTQLLETSKQGYEHSHKLFAMGKTTLATIVEWSVRLRTAEANVARTPEERRKAYKDHIDRLADLETLMKAKAAGGMEGIEAALYARYYHLEAQVEIAQLP